MNYWRVLKVADMVAQVGEVGGDVRAVATDVAVQKACVQFAADLRQAGCSGRTLIGETNSAWRDRRGPRGSR